MILENQKKKKYYYYKRIYAMFENRLKWDIIIICENHKHNQL